MTVWDQFQPSLGEQLAEDLREMAAAFDRAAARSQQASLGPSEIGNPCSRCLARKILGIQPTSVSDPWCAIIGTAVHAWLDKAAEAANVEADTEWRWLPEVKVDVHEQLLPDGGKADLFDRTTRTVIDHKIVGRERLRNFKASGPSLTYRRQAHLYGLGYTNIGEPVHNVAIAFWHRGGSLRDLWVWTEPYDPQVAAEALDRYATLRSLCDALGPAVVVQLPTDPGCYDCGRYADAA